jgi:hypothetical protein
MRRAVPTAVTAQSPSTGIIGADPPTFRCLLILRGMILPGSPAKATSHTSSQLAGQRLAVGADTARNPAHKVSPTFTRCVSFVKNVIIVTLPSNT